LHYEKRKITINFSPYWVFGNLLSSNEEPRQLPVRGVALRRIYYDLKANKATLPTACGTVADEVMPFWAEANNMTTAKPHVVSKLKALHQQHVQVSKHKKRQSATQAGLESDITHSMSQLFDTAHADCKNEHRFQKIEFLIDQCGPRQMSMTTGIEKLLGIPMLPVGSGAMVGQKVVEFVRDYAGV